MDKRRSMDSDEYQSYLADIRDKKRSRILKALKKKKEIYEKSTRKLHALRAQYSKIPAVTSRIHFDGLIRTQEDVLLIPEVKKLFASVHNFEELISATHSVIAMLSDLGCFDDVFAEIDTDESSNERYEVTFKLDEYGLLSITPALSNSTPLSNQSVRINPVISARLLNVFGRAESLEAEHGTTLFSTDRNTNFQRILFSKPFANHSNLNILGEILNYPLGNPYEQLCKESNIRATAYWFPAYWWQHSLSLGASWRQLSVESSKSVAFASREECGHSLKTSLCHELILDTTNDDLLPTSGIYLELKQEFAGILGNVRFVKNSLQLSAFLPLIQGLSLGVGMSMGRLATPTTELPEDQHYFSKNNVTSLDRFGNGGPLSTRGFAHRGLGSYLGSDSFWAVSSKLIASLPFIRQSWILDNIKAHCFLDVAGDTSMMGLFGRSRELRASAGFGFAFKILNFGRGELNYSVPLRAHSGDRVVHGVQFGLGLDFL